MYDAQMLYCRGLQPIAYTYPESFKSGQAVSTIVHQNFDRGLLENL